MIVNKDYVFVHIPKTGGGHIASVMKRNLKATSDQNFAHNKPDKEFLETHKNKWFFTMVRNPYHMLASAYRFRYVLPEMGLRKKSDKVMTFSEMLDFGIEHNELFLQSSYLTNKMRIFRYENGMEQVINYLGLHDKIDEAKAKKVHYYGEYDFTQYYTPELIDKVKRLYKKDFETLGYPIEYERSY